MAETRDPREMTPTQLDAMGYERMSPMQAIRAKCLYCCMGKPQEVRLCVDRACVNWPYRMGKSPFRMDGNSEAV